jgi:hypothetical protein
MLCSERVPSERSPYQNRKIQNIHSLMLFLSADCTGCLSPRHLTAEA